MYLFGLQVKLTIASIHSKVEAISLSVLLKDTANELDGLSSHYSFNAERQARKL